MGFFDVFPWIFTRSDLFGRTVELYINNQTKVRSKFSAFVSISILAFSFYLLVRTFISWSNNENLQIISSSTSFSVSELLIQNRSYIYELDYTNYNIYFALTAYINETTTLNYTQLERYLTQSFYYFDQNNNVLKLNFEDCSMVNQAIFLGTQTSDNETSDLNICLSEKIKMGLVTKETQKGILSPLFYYQIDKCVNSSDNNNFCATNDEISLMLTKVRLQASIPKSIYDFNNPNYPRKRTYDYQFYYLDSQLLKSFTAKLLPIRVETDIGAFSEEYTLDTVDFNVENLNTETYSINEQQSTLFVYYIQFGFDQQTYYRKNQKFYQLIGNFGGMVNILFIFGRVVCYTYNLLVLKYRLINISFENLEKKGKSGVKEQENNEKNFKFSIFSLICPKFVNNTVYDEALNNLYEYMDIHNIIKRFQDVDKLKLVLLDENQRRVFDNLPKPGIIGKSNRGKSFLTMETINMPKKNKFRRNSRHKYGFLLNGDPINRRIFNMMEPNLKSEIRQMQENKCIDSSSIPSPNINVQDSQMIFPKTITNLNLKKTIELEEIKIEEEDNNIEDVKQEIHENEKTIQGEKNEPMFSETIVFNGKKISNENKSISFNEEDKNYQGIKQEIPENKDYEENTGRLLIEFTELSQKKKTNENKSSSYIEEEKSQDINNLDIHEKEKTIPEEITGRIFSETTLLKEKKKTNLNRSSLF